MFENEEWIKTYVSDDYEVSNYGRFRSIDRVVVSVTGYVRNLSGKNIKPFLAKWTGYLQVKIHGKKINAHRIVAMAFCQGYREGLVVNHKNGIRTDNRSENLEWITPSENVSHGYRVLNRVPTSLGKFGEDHVSSKAVIATSIKTGKSIRYGSAMDAVREGFDSSSISRCCNGIRACHKGYYWRFEGAHHA